MDGRLLIGAMVGLGLVVAGCGDGGRAAAEAALTSAQSAFDAVKDDATAYAPDEMKSVDTALANARGLVAKGEHAQALSEATSTAPKIAALAETVATKKAAAAASWTQLSEELPKALEEVQGQLATLSKSRRLPKGVTKATLGDAKGRIETLANEWADATKAFSAGNLVDAVSKGQAIKAGLSEVKASLGMLS